MILFAKQKQGHDVDKKPIDSQGQGVQGMGGMNWQIGIDIYTTMYKIDNKWLISYYL